MIINKKMNSLEQQSCSICLGMLRPLSNADDGRSFGAGVAHALLGRSTEFWQEVIISRPTDHVRETDFDETFSIRHLDVIQIYSRL